MPNWITDQAQAIAETAVRELEALVAISTPSGDVRAAEEAASVAAALAPAEAAVERIPCSSPGHAPDLLLRLSGSGQARLLLVGHLDTVIAHGDHLPLHPDPADPDRLIGSGTIDMKGGDVLALGVLRALAQRPGDFAAAELLLVCDEEWRLGEFAHTDRFAGFDACLCFEGGQLDAEGRDAVVVRRKAAGSIKVTAHGRSAHSGSKPDEGRNALLALAAAAQAIAACHDPHGPDHRSAVPTVIRAGGPLNVVPDHGELICDVRADTLEAVEAVMASVPGEVGGARLTSENLRRWPGMDSAMAVTGVLERAGSLLGRPVVAASRGGASDASHFAAAIPVTIDGLGPLGGDAHAPQEWVSAASMRSRAEVALALVQAVLLCSR